MYFNYFPQLLTVVLACTHATAQKNFEKPEDLQATDEAIPHQGCEGILRDRTGVQEPLVGADYQRTHKTRYRVDQEAGSTAAECKDGKAGGYDCNNIDLLSVMRSQDLAVNIGGGSPEFNDIWGWTDIDSGREFALVGLKSGTAFVEITDPYNPVYLGGLKTQTFDSSWRDIKTHGHHAVIGSEASGHGVQIFDLRELLRTTSPKTFSTTARFTGVGNTHNVFCTENGSDFCYSVGTRSTCGGGIVAIDMSDPKNPTSPGCFSSDGYSHDVQCVIYNGPDRNYAGKEICFGSNEDTVTIVDATDKGNMKQISKSRYNNARYTHQGWLTDDHKYFIFGDELDERGLSVKTRTYVVDVSDLENPVDKQFYTGRTLAIDHNQYVKGEYVYQANYRAGLNILKIKDLGGSDVNKFEEVGMFDVYSGSDSASFNGAWSTYPFFPSGSILVSSIEGLMFVVKHVGAKPPRPTRAPVRPPTRAPVGVETDVPTAPTSSFLPTSYYPNSQVPTPNLSDEDTAEPTSGEPTSSEPTSSEPTTSEPTTSEPTTSEPTSGEPEGNICALANKKNCQAAGCVLDGKDCNTCSTLSKKSKKSKCTEAGCNWDGDADDQCWSCNTMDSKKDCAKASCVWTDVKDIGEMCSPCTSITKSKICKKACAYDKKADVVCSSCSLLTSKKECKKFKKGCAWEKKACISKKA